MTALVAQFDDAPHHSTRLWMVAAAGALALHLALAALFITTLDNDDDSDLGAPGLTIGLDLASPSRDPSDLPAGPDSEASVASPAIQEQKAVVKDSDLPKDQPTETNDPDRIVTENKTNKPEQDDPNLKATPQNASAESVASEATATPSLQAVPEAATATTRDQGTGESRQRLRATWAKELVAHLDKHKKYPAERSQQAAQILVNFTINRVGKVQAVAVVKGSGDPVFDEAAMAMIRRSDPVPAPPPLIADEGLSFTLPVNFRVKGQR